MPRKYRKRIYRKRKSKRRSSKKVSSRKLLRDAKRPGINSVAERAVAIIARKEAEKLLGPNLIFRRFAFCDYNRTTNQFLNPSLLDMNGAVVHMLQIPLNDNTTQISVAPATDISLRPPVPTYDRGVNIISTTLDQQGYRSSNRVEIKNLGVQMRFEQMSFDASSPNLPRKEYAQVTYAIVAVNSPDAHNLQWTPTIEQLLPFKGFGYSSRLDEEGTAQEDTKLRYLKRGSCKIFQKQTLHQEVFKSLYWKGSLPYEYQSADPTVPLFADQNGQRVTGKWKVFFAIRSDIPVATHNDFKAGMAVCMKAGYRNVT